jgi:hypothetical protein
MIDCTAVQHSVSCEQHQDYQQRYWSTNTNTTVYGVYISGIKAHAQYTLTTAVMVVPYQSLSVAISASLQSKRAAHYRRLAPHAMTISTNAAAVLQAAAAAAAAVVASAGAAADDCSRVHSHHVYRLLQTEQLEKLVTAWQQFRIRVSTRCLILQRTYTIIKLIALEYSLHINVLMPLPVAAVHSTS